MIVADTHSWLWWLTDRTLLSSRALEALNGDIVAISPITFWEVATLVRRRRITVATAILEGVPLVTKDRKIIDSNAVPTIW